MTDEEKQTLRNALSDAAAYKDQWEAIRAERDVLLKQVAVLQAGLAVAEGGRRGAELNLKWLKEGILRVAKGDEGDGPLCQCDDPECPYKDEP